MRQTEFCCANPTKVRLLTTLFGLSNLCKHKFKHSFHVTLNQLWNCGKQVKIFYHLLVKFSKRMTPEQNQKYISENSNSGTTHFLLSGAKVFTASSNFIVLISAIEYILSIKTSDKSLFLEWFYLLLICSYNHICSYVLTQSFNICIISQGWYFILTWLW